MAKTAEGPAAETRRVEPGAWASRMAALGPGILMASAAIGGSHLISSTQAGARFGWQLAFVIVVANLLKYPFFRFGPQYTVESGRSLVEGYARRADGQAGPNHRHRPLVEQRFAVPADRLQDPVVAE